MKQGQKEFRATSTSCKAIRNTSSALRWSPTQYYYRPLLLNFRNETGSHPTMPQFIKVQKHKKSSPEAQAFLELVLTKIKSAQIFQNSVRKIRLYVVQVWTMFETLC